MHSQVQLTPQEPYAARHPPVLNGIQTHKGRAACDAQVASNFIISTASHPVCRRLLGERFSQGQLKMLQRYMLLVSMFAINTKNWATSPCEKPTHKESPKVNEWKHFAHPRWPKPFLVGSLGHC